MRVGAPKDCFRVSYVCKSQRLFFYKSFKTSLEAAYYVYFVYRMSFDFFGNSRNTKSF